MDSDMSHLAVSTLPSLKAPLNAHIRATDLLSRLKVRGVDRWDEAGELIWGEIGPIACAILAAGPCEIVQEGSRLERGYFLKLQLEGEAKVSQGDMVTTLQPNDFALLDVAAPQKLELSEGARVLVFCLPLDLLRPSIDVRMLSGLVVKSSHPQSSLCTDYLKSLWKQCSHQNSDLISKSALRVLCDLISLCMPKLTDSSNVRTPRVAWSEIERYVDQRRFDPDLSVQGMARDLSLTPRRLQQIFGALGTNPQRYIQDLRLDEAKRRISDLAFQDDNITQIAFDVGFRDLSHFSKCFRARYGLSPRSARRGDAP